MMKESRKKLFYIVIFVWCNIAMVEGIIGGYNASSGQLNYQVSVRANDKHICGGAILSNQHIVTAAHCVITERNDFERYKLTVVGGVIDIEKQSINRIVVDVEKVYVPKEYIFFNPIFDIADIAILKLKNKINLSEGSPLKKLNLPESEYLHSSYENEIAIISGFGFNTLIQAHDGPRLSQNGFYLKFSKTLILHSMMCSFMYHIPVTDKIVCAQVIKSNFQNHEGICDGDSGGPLVINNSIIIGVLSKGDNMCDETEKAGVYVRIAAYLPFIRKAMRDECSPDIRIAEYKFQNVYLCSFKKKEVLIESVHKNE